MLLRHAGSADDRKHTQLANAGVAVGATNGCFHLWRAAAMGRKPPALRLRRLVSRRGSRLGRCGRLRCLSPHRPQNI